MCDIVNVLLHGVFGYVFREKFIEAYTPAVFGHIYRAGSVHYKGAKEIKKRMDYTLMGVCGSYGDYQQPDPTCFPVMRLPDTNEIDPFDNRFCMIRLPYPAKTQEIPKQLYALDAYNLGSVYAGKHCSPLNVLKSFPSLLALVYKRDTSKPLYLVPDDGSEGIDLSDLRPKPGTSITNLHIWCTLDPDDMAMSSMTAEGHIRRAFAGLVDLFPCLETTLQIPDGFSPTSALEVRPPGVDPNDVDPGRPPGPDFGKVNCHYSNLMFLP